MNIIAIATISISPQTTLAGEITAVKIAHPDGTVLRTRVGKAATAAETGAAITTAAIAAAVVTPLGIPVLVAVTPAADSVAETAAVIGERPSLKLKLPAMQAAQMQEQR